jgi:hypothetical protein
MLIPDYVKAELRFLSWRLCVLGVIAYIISGFFWQWTLSFGLGLVFGIFCVMGNIFVLGVVSLRATQRGARAAKAIMTVSYFCRIVALGFCLWLAFAVPWLNPIAFFITPAFVNIIYFVDALIYKNGR